MIRVCRICKNAVGQYHKNEINEKTEDVKVGRPLNKEMNCKQKSCAKKSESQNQKIG